MALPVGRYGLRVRVVSAHNGGSRRRFISSLRDGDMALFSVDVTVPGHAASLSATQNIAEPWKLSVWQAVKDVWQQGYLKEPCAVRFTFNLETSLYKQTAVYNLLKSTTDGLSRAIFDKCPGGSEWNREDWRIVQLHARKQVATQAPSVRIEIDPPTSQPLHVTENLLAHTFVPGSPPLWPGDSVGATKVMKWREHLVQSLEVAKQPDVSMALGCDFHFAVEPDRMQTSDLDNFCVPAAQAVGRALFGDVNQARRLIGLHATKMGVSGDNQLGTRVRVWQE